MGCRLAPASLHTCVYGDVPTRRNSPAPRYSSASFRPRVRGAPLRPGRHAGSGDRRDRQNDASRTSGGSVLATWHARWHGMAIANFFAAHAAATAPTAFRDPMAFATSAYLLVTTAAFTSVSVAFGRQRLQARKPAAPACSLAVRKETSQRFASRAPPVPCPRPAAPTRSRLIRRSTNLRSVIHWHMTLPPWRQTGVQCCPCSAPLSQPVHAQRAASNAAKHALQS